MPVLPGSPQRLTPNPSTSVAQYTGGVAEQAQMTQGEAVSKLGSDMVQMADQRRNQLDELRVIDAATALRRENLRLTFDPKEGYQSVQGGDVLSRPLAQDYATLHKQAADGIAASLSPRQREMFAGHVASDSVNFQAGVMRHAMTEAEKYSGEVYKNDLISRYDTATAAYKNPEVTNSQLDGIDRATFHRMDTQGINDPALRDQFVKAARGGLHAAVINTAITAGDTTFANDYLKANKKDMTGDQLKAVEHQLKPATDFAAGKVLAQDAFQKELQDPTFNAALYIADKAGSSPQVAAEAYSLYVQAVHEKNVAETTQLGTVYKQFWSDQIPNRATMNTIRNSPLFRNLNDAQQGAALHTMQQAVQSAEDRAVNKEYQIESRDYQQETRAYMQKQRAESELVHSLPAITATTAIRNDPRFSNMPPEEIYGYVGKIGVANVQHLIEWQAVKNKEFRNFQVDPQMLREAKPESVLKNKTQSAAIDGMVETAAQKFMMNNGRVPTRDEQRSIVSSVMSQQVETPGLLWGTNTKELYKLPPDQRTFYLGTKSAAEKANITPPTDAELNSMWKLVKDKKASKPSATVPATPSGGAQPGGWEDNAPAKTSTLPPDVQAKVAKIDAARAAEKANNVAMDASIDNAPPAPKPEAAVVSAYPGVNEKVESAPLSKADERAYEKTVEKAVATPLPAPTAVGGDPTFTEKGFTTQKGKLPLPANGRTVSTFSPAHTAKDNGGTHTVPSKGGRRTYTTEDAPIKAVADGTVVFADYLRGYDEVVVVKHGDYLSVYQNNKSLGVKEGDKVLKGSIIGNAKGGETNFELRHKSVTIDPMQWLKKAGK